MDGYVFHYSYFINSKNIRNPRIWSQEALVKLDDEEFEDVLGLGLCCKNVWNKNFFVLLLKNLIIFKTI